MKSRVLSALVGIPLVLAGVFLSGPAVYWAIVAALTLLALHEYLSLCGTEPVVTAGINVAALLALAGLPVGAGSGPAAAGLLTVVLVSLWRVQDPARRLQGLGEGVLGLAYIVYATSCLYLMRALPSGPYWILLVLAVTWSGDSAAFFGGTRFGRRRFAPVLSPKKTWAGAVWGLAGSLAGGLVVSLAFPRRESLAMVAAVSLAVGLAGQLGDLFESLWKRAKGVKDSGALIPGHGGILDRIDSLLLGLPVGYHIVRHWGR